MRPRGEETASPALLRLAQHLLAKQGFGRVSADDLADAAGLDRREVRRLFPSPEALEAAALRLALETDEWTLDAACARARDLADDPLQIALVAARFLADSVAEAEDDRVPGWRLAAAALRQRSHAPGVEAIARDGIARLRTRLLHLFASVAAKSPPQTPLSAAALTDLALAALEGPPDRPLDARGDAQIIMAFRTFLRLLHPERVESQPPAS